MGKNMKKNEKKQIKIGLFSMHTAPYKDPVFEEVSNNKKFDVEIITLFEKAKTHNEWAEIEPNYENSFLGKHINIPIFGEFHLGLFKILYNGKYDVIMVTGYYPLTNFILLLYSVFFRKPFIYSADSTSLPLGNIYKENSFKLNLKKYFINKSSAIWVPGEASLQYHHKVLEVDEAKIFKGSYTLDSKYLYNEITQLNLDKDRFRKSLGLSKDDFVFLFVGKLISNRNIKNLLKAFIEANKENSNISLIVIGDGPETSIITDFVRQHKKTQVIHINAVTFEELHSFYSCCDAYVHPGSEPYSLALVEAVIAGKPILSTNEVGAVYDYVEDDYNGYVVRNNDILALTKAMVKLSVNRISEDNVKQMQDFIVCERNKYWASEQLIEALELAIRK